MSCKSEVCMLLKRYSVYKKGNSEFYICDNLKEEINEYGYEMLESALRECDEWNRKDKTLEKEAIFASKKELSNILEITITLVDGSELFLEIDKCTSNSSSVKLDVKNVLNLLFIRYCKIGSQI